MFGIDIKRKEALVLFKYLFKGMSNPEFKSKVSNGKDLKSKVDNSGYILKNCKAYAYAYYSYKQGILKKKPKRKDYQLVMEDALLLRKLDLSFINTRFKAFNLQEYDFILQELFLSKELNSYVGKFVNKKMTFMINSYGDSFNGLKSELMAAGLYTIYRQYPYFESYLHVMNIAKAGIHNFGQDLIKNRTAQKNQRLGKNEDGTFYQKCIPLSKVENFIVVEQENPDFVFESVEMKPKAKKLLLLLSGKYDAEFSNYLGSDNDVAALSMRYSSYTKHVQEYLEVSPKQVRRFFEKVRDRMPYLK